MNVFSDTKKGLEFEHYLTIFIISKQKFLFFIGIFLNYKKNNINKKTRTLENIISISLYKSNIIIYLRYKIKIKTKILSQLDIVSINNLNK